MIFQKCNHSNYFLTCLCFLFLVNSLSNHSFSKHLNKAKESSRNAVENYYSASRLERSFGQIRSEYYIRRYNNRRRIMNDDISLWIDEQQVKIFSGYLMEIFVILDGKVLPYVLSPSFEKELPVIPYGMERVNFTWRSGKSVYFYEFFNLLSNDEDLVYHPYLSIRKKGTVPGKKKKFSISVNCTGKATGISRFNIGLKIRNKHMTDLSGTPLIIGLQKECLTSGFDETCHNKCFNGGICDSEKKCRCTEGYMGTFCQSALCYPQCRNEGICTIPGVCSCMHGYHGRYCEGGICKERCLNRGKCIQKDTCLCKNGFYGNRCEFSKCIIPCINGGKCKGVNKCRCSHGFSGDHCQIISYRKLLKVIRKCKKKCRHGRCSEYGQCKCERKYLGRWCKKKKFQRKKNKHPKIWI